ncbi:hypothetical protein ABMA27_001338 [Loxostege sticticalis]|uniref:FLYWCH-type domain-containing protein n=1 Tax=Loxostege sticticalis TaxID=481309 RepID=A0ABR3HY51_LOXSC
MVDGYTFSKANKISHTWHCSSRGMMNCKARVRIDRSNTLVCVLLEHNHPPPKYIVTKDGQYLNYKLINSGRSQLLMVDGYTFSKANKISRTWHCSSSGMMNCKARVRIDRSNTLVCVLLEHNHPPPNYVVTKDGQYCKV